MPKEAAPVVRPWVLSLPLRSAPSPLFLAHFGENMKSLRNIIAGVISDEQGGEVIEYALIAGLISIAAIVTITAVGTKVLAHWNSINSSM